MPWDHIATYVRPVEQQNRRGSQINRATKCSKTCSLRSQIVGGRRQVLHSRTTVARPVVGGLARWWMIGKSPVVRLCVGPIVRLTSGRGTGSTIDRASLRLMLQLVVTSKEESSAASNFLCLSLSVCEPFLSKLRKQYCKKYK